MISIPRYSKAISLRSIEPFERLCWGCSGSARKPGYRAGASGRLAAHFIAAGDRFRPKAARYARLAAAEGDPSVWPHRGMWLPGTWRSGLLGDDPDGCR
jgi:hypothetical protein